MLLVPTPWLQPPLAEAESMRAAAISTLAQRLVQRRLPPLVRAFSVAGAVVLALWGACALDGLG